MFVFRSVSLFFNFTESKIKMFPQISIQFPSSSSKCILPLSFWQSVGGHQSPSPTSITSLLFSDNDDEEDGENIATTNFQVPLEFCLIDLNRTAKLNVHQTKFKNFIINDLAIEKMGVACDAPPLLQSTHALVVGVRVVKCPKRRKRSGKINVNISDACCWYSTTPKTENNSNQKLTSFAILGFVMFSFQKNLFFDVHIFHVEPACRRMGLASKMIDQARKIMIPNSTNKNWIEVVRFGEPTEDGKKFLIKWHQKTGGVKNVREEDEEEELVSRFSFRYY